MTTSNRLGITELAETQNNRHVTVNEMLAILEAVAGGTTQANSVGDNAPPGSPAEGDVYVVGTAGTGTFTGHNEAIAVYYNAGWLFVTPLKGFKAYAQDDDTAYIFDGSDWQLDPAGGGAVAAAAVSYSNGGSGLTATDVQAAIDEVVARILAASVGMAKRGRVRAATTANITIATALNNGDTLDGVSLVTGDLVLVKDQAAPEQNGIYVVGASPARSTEFDTYDEHPGSLLAVEEGTASADTMWLCTSNVGGTLNTTAIVFTQLVITGSVPSSRLISAGTGMTGGGNLSADRTLSIDKASDAEVRSSASNKVLTTDLVESASAYVTLTDGANISLDWDAGINRALTIGGNRTLDNPTNGQPGTWRAIKVTQDGTGSRTLAFGNQYKFVGGTEPVLTAAAGSVDFLNIFCDTATNFFVFFGLDIKQ